MFTRRHILAITGALALPPLTLNAQVEEGSGAIVPELPPSEKSLHRFMVKALGTNRSERATLAQETIGAVNPLDTTDLLVECAAYGVFVRSSNVKDVLDEGYHRLSRQSLDLAKQTYSESPWPYALDASWHYEVTRRSKLGSLYFGASKSDGNELFEKAFALNTSDPGIELTHIISLLSDSPKKHAKPALAALRTVEELAPSSEYDPVYIETIQGHCAELLSLLIAEDFAAVKSRVLEIF